MSHITGAALSCSFSAWYVAIAQHSFEQGWQKGAGGAPPVVVVQGGRRALLQLLREALQEGAPPGRRAQRGHKVRLRGPSTSTSGISSKSWEPWAHGRSLVMKAAKAMHGSRQKSASDYQRVLQESYLHTASLAAVCWNTRPF